MKSEDFDFFSQFLRFLIKIPENVKKCDCSTISINKLLTLNFHGTRSDQLRAIVSHCSCVLIQLVLFIGSM